MMLSSNRRRQQLVAEEGNRLPWATSPHFSPGVYCGRRAGAETETDTGPCRLWRPKTRAEELAWSTNQAERPSACPTTHDAR